MKRIKKVLLISIITLILVISISYAWFIMSVNQDGINEIVGGNASCLNITKLSETTGINLNNTIPIIDSEGEKLTPYTMTIKNDCNINVNFVATMDY